MKGVFADTAYWIAISNPHDFLHDRARQISRSLPSKRLVTSEMVFTEVLNDFGQRGEFLRRLAARLVGRARVDRNLVVVGQTRRQFRDALALYSERSDKSWSLTDCASFRIMEQYGIREALTYDRHFVQAGFRPCFATIRRPFRYYRSKSASSLRSAALPAAIDSSGQSGRHATRMQCPQCQHENPPGAKFCVECASPIVRRCPACGTEAPPTGKFCPECAAPLQVSGAGSQVSGPHPNTQHPTPIPRASAGS